VGGQLLAGKGNLPVIDLDIVPEITRQPRDTLLDQVTAIHAMFLPPAIHEDAPRAYPRICRDTKPHPGIEEKLPVHALATGLDLQTSDEGYRFSRPGDGETGWLQRALMPMRGTRH
jgi:hypothetical protein